MDAKILDIIIIIIILNCMVNKNLSILARYLQGMLNSTTKYSIRLSQRKFDFCFGTLVFKQSLDFRLSEMN